MAMKSKSEAIDKLMSRQKAVTEELLLEQDAVMDTLRQSAVKKAEVIREERHQETL